MNKRKKRQPLPQNDDVGGMYALTYFALTAFGAILVGVVAIIVLIVC